jgi:hypothetical protein
VNAIRNLGLAAIAGLLVSATPFVVGIAFALRPNERWLALMRPLTLAGIFAAVANTCLGFANTFVGLERLGPSSAPGRFYAMLAETSVVPFVSFVSLSVAWLCVALGMRRQHP